MFLSVRSPTKGRHPLSERYVALALYSLAPCGRWDQTQTREAEVLGGAVCHANGKVRSATAVHCVKERGGERERETSGPF